MAPDFFFADQYQSGTDLTLEVVANLYPSQEFLNAHLAYFDRLLIQPSRRFHKARWGLKEISLTADDACYLRWLLPNARFLFSSLLSQAYRPSETIPLITGSQIDSLDGPPRSAIGCTMLKQ